MDLSVTDNGDFVVNPSTGDFSYAIESDFLAQHVRVTANSDAGNTIIPGAGLGSYVGSLNNEATAKKIRRTLADALNRGLHNVEPGNFVVDAYPTSLDTISIPVFATAFGNAKPVTLLSFSFTEGVTTIRSSIESNSQVIGRNARVSNPVVNRNFRN